MPILSDVLFLIPSNYLGGGSVLFVSDPHCILRPCSCMFCIMCVYIDLLQMFRRGTREITRLRGRKLSALSRLGLGPCEALGLLSEVRPVRAVPAVHGGRAQHLPAGGLEGSRRGLKGPG